jgi:hypothetical protein
MTAKHAIARTLYVIAILVGWPFLSEVISRAVGYLFSIVPPFIPILLSAVAHVLLAFLGMRYLVGRTATPRWAWVVLAGWAALVALLVPFWMRDVARAAAEEPGLWQGALGISLTSSSLAVEWLYLAAPLVAGAVAGFIGAGEPCLRVRRVCGLPNKRIEQTRRR